MKIEFEGRVYDYELDRLTVKQSVQIEAHITGTLLDWEEGLSRASALCLQALGWMILRDGDLNVAIDTVDFPVMPLARAWLAANEAEAAASAAALAGDEPDPSSSPSPLPEASQASRVPAPPAAFPASSPTG